MELLKKRKYAVIITVIVAVLATLIGVNKSLSRLSRDIEGMFYDGVYLESSGYTQPGIDTQIAKHSDAALGLATVLINYPELQNSAEEVLGLRRELLDAVSISEKSLAFGILSQKVNNLIQAAPEVKLTERDIIAVARYSVTIDGAETFITNAAYNEKASELWNERSIFARVLGVILPARAPDMF